MDLPADIANQALDAIGADTVIGDLNEGTFAAQVCVRAYGQCVRQMLRAANWSFARKQVKLVLLGDVTGQTPEVGSLVQFPWRFAYAYPIDCMRVRFVPWTRESLFSPAPPGNTALPDVPLTTGENFPANFGIPLRPAKFLIGSDMNYPPQAGAQFWETQGESPAGRTVIMCNVPHAHAVYTYFNPYPSVWDALFRAALVAYLGSEVAVAIWRRQGDMKTGLAIKAQQIAIVKSKVEEARLVDGNESFTSSDISVDWMRTRRGGWGGNWYGGGGVSETVGYGYLTEAWGDCGGLLNTGARTAY